MLLTREVLRLSLHDDAIEPTVSPCPDWWLELQELPDGIIRVRAEGQVRDATARVWDRMPPPLDYTFADGPQPRQLTRIP